MLGKTILGYTVDKEIGSGGFGTVYKVSKSNIAGTEIRALKHISIPSKKQYMDVLNSMGGDQQKADDYFVGVLKNVINEIQIIRSMSSGRTANIVTYYENDIEEHGSPRTYDVYILMEYLKPLTDYASENVLVVSDVVRLAKDMLAALIACHSHNVIHRDIKEDNIFVSQDGVFKLGDFGVSKVLKDRSSAESMKGTPNYIAPEVYLGKEKYNNSVDLYSLGIVLYRMLNGFRGPFMPTYPAPYTSTDEDIAFEKRMKYMTPDLPYFAKNALGEAVIRAIKPKGERYATAQEFMEAITRAVSTLTSTELNASVTTSMPKYAVEQTPVGGRPTQGETFGSDYQPQIPQTPRKAEPNRFQSISDTYSHQQEQPTPPQPAYTDDPFDVDEPAYEPTPPPSPAPPVPPYPPQPGKAKRSGRDDRKTIMYVIPVVIIILYIIMYMVIGTMVADKGVSIIEWLFHNAEEIADTINSGQVLEAMGNVDLPRIPVAAIIAIKILNWILLSALITSLYFIGRSLHFKEPDINEAAALRGKEAYLKVMEISEAMKRSNSPDTLKARNAVKSLLERLKNESAFGVGGAQVIVCENEIAACISAIENNVSGLFNESTVQLAAANIEAQCEKIRSKLRIRIELKKK